MYFIFSVICKVNFIIEIQKYHTTKAVPKISMKIVEISDSRGCMIWQK
jgi:hypothetical protein